MKILLLFILPYILFAKCNYELKLNFDYKESLVKANAKITSDKTLNINYDSLKSFDSINLTKDKNNINISFNKKFDQYITSDFIHLLSDFYPEVKEYCSYDVTILLPKGFEVIMEAEKIIKNEKENGMEFNFVMPKEITSISLIASKNFITKHKTYNGIDIFIYFLREDENLSNSYLDKTIEYIKLYESMIAPFPYKRFSIVENYFQTGYSMPTFTLIGNKILSKDFVLNRSLAHEILHQYFGNSLFNDFNSGNFIEGLVTFLSDWYIEKDKIKMRKEALNSYQTFVDDKNEFEAYKFTTRFNHTSMAIGYSKVAFIFHMLEQKIGKKKFLELISEFYKKNQFKEANIKELKEFFTSYEPNLELFFDYWFYKKSIIDFEIKDMKSFYDNGFFVEFILENKKQFYPYNLNVTINTYENEINKTILINKKNQKISIKLDSEPLRVSFDKDYDLFRKLSIDEDYNTIGKLFATKELFIVKDFNLKDKYLEIEKIFKNSKIISTRDFKFFDLKNRNVIFLDKNNELVSEIFGLQNMKNSTIDVRENIYNPKNSIAILHTNDNLDKFFLLKHYLNYSKVTFEENNIKKEINKNNYGMIFKFNEKPLFQRVQKAKNLEDINNEIKNKKIIYIGEDHGNFTNHLNQLRIIKSLYRQNKKIAIAMEMFVSDFQNVLDDYIDDKIDLNLFLKESQYYKTWGFDYNNYKPIIDFAKENKIKILAVNIDRNITKEVSKKGIFALSKELKSKLPREIDQTNIIYKKNLEDIFSQNHSQIKIEKEKNINYFYQAQLIWDEIMAEKIDDFLINNKDYLVAVIVGSGHIKDYHGIPSRVYRKNGYDYLVVLNDEFSNNEGDLIIKNKSFVKIKNEKKLGVLIESDENLTIKDVLNNSFASLRGLKKDDLIISINDENISTIYDIKRILYLNDLDNIKIKILRANKELIK